MTASDPADYGPEITSLLTSEHVRFRRDLENLVAEPDAFARRDAFEDLARRLVRHGVGEDATIYPVIAQLDGGAALRSEGLRQQRELARYLARTMRRLTFRARGHKTSNLIGELKSVLERHLLFEEDVVIPVVAALEDEHKRQMMGSWARQIEALAPTRPHPHGPQRLPGLVMVAPLLAVSDRVRDGARSLLRPKRPVLRRLLERRR